MRKIAIFLVDGVEEVEAVTPIDIFRRSNLTVDLITLKDKIVTGGHDIAIQADIHIDDMDINNYDAIVCPGGSTELANSNKLLSFIKDFFDKGKLVAAICAAPVALSKAGILKGKKFTCYPSFENSINEGIYQKNLNIVIDGNIITAAGPAFASEFAFQIVTYLLDKDSADKVRKEMLFI